MKNILGYALLLLSVIVFLLSCELPKQENIETEIPKLALSQDGIFALADSILLQYKNIESQKECTLTWLEEYRNALHAAMDERYGWSNDSMDLRVYLIENKSSYSVSSIRKGTESFDSVLPKHIENKLKGTHQCLELEYNQTHYGNLNNRCSKIYRELAVPMIVEFCSVSPFGI